MGSAVSAHNLTTQQELELYVHLHEACNEKLISMGVLESKVPLDEQIMKTDLVAIREEISAATTGKPLPAPHTKGKSSDEQAAAARIQALQRGNAARKEITVQKEAATKVQAVVRGRAERTRANEVDNLVDWDNGDHGAKDDISTTAEKERAAIILQGKVRQKKAEIEVFKKKEHELAEQEFIQRGIEAAEKEEQEEAATALQAAVRGKLAREAMQDKSTSKEESKEESASSAEKKSD